MAENEVVVRIRAQDAGAIKALGALMRALDQTGKTTGSSSANLRRARQETEAFTGAQNAAAAAVNRLSRRLLGLAAAFVGVRTLRDFVSAGLQFNSTIETSTLGIASLISAQSELTDSSGRAVQGQEKLDAALQLSADQVRALRVAGIQTAATTEQLVEAFQQAVGAGLAARLTLDEIRKVTIQVVQAAGALGVPLNQLNQEVRSILDETIDRNSRVAKALGITNEAVRAAREQGTLFEFLTERFNAFSVAGERVALTLPAVTSNLRDALSLVAGEAVEPLFDQLKRTLQGALESVFDFDTAGLTPAFRGLVDAARDVFGNVGDLLRDAIESAVENAQDLSQWLAANRTEVSGIVTSMFQAGTAAAELVGAAASLVGHLIAGASELGLITGLLRTASDTINFIRENVVLIAAIGAGVGIARLLTFIGGISALPTAIGLVLVTHPILAAVAALGALVVAVNTFRARQEAAIRAETEAIRTRAQHTVETARLSAEFNRLTDAINSGKLEGDELSEAQNKIRDVQQKLIDQSPELRKAIQGAGEDYRDQAAAIREVAAAELRRQEAEAQGIRAELESLRARQQSLNERIGRTEGVLSAAAAERDLVQAGQRAQQLRDLDAQIAEREKRLEILQGALTESAIATAAVPLPDVPVPRIAPTQEQLRQQAEEARQQALRALQADAATSTELIRAAVQRQQRELDQQLEDAQISYREHTQRVTAIQLQALDEQIALQQRVLRLTTGTADRAKILADIKQLEDQKLAVVEDGARRRAEAERRLADEVTQAQVQLLRAEGATVAARTIELELQFREVIARLLAEGDLAGVALIRKLIRTDLARTAVDELSRQLSEAESRVTDDITRVQARQSAGSISQLQAQRELVVLYRQQQQLLTELVTRLRAIAAANPNPEINAQLREAENRLSQINIALEAQVDSWRRIGVSIQDTAQSTLSTFLGSTINQVDSLGEALRGFALSLAQSVQQIMADIIARAVIGALFVRKVTEAAGGTAPAQTAAAAGALVAAGQTVSQGAVETGIAAGALTIAGQTVGAAARELAAAAALMAVITLPVRGFASGGLIRGPGTGRSDSILARLSHGEYVVSADATSRNLSLLEMINGATRPYTITSPRSIPRFADGGLVSASGGNGEGGSTSVMVALEEGLVARHIESRSGGRAVVRVVQQNRQAIRQALGIR